MTHHTEDPGKKAEHIADKAMEDAYKEDPGSNIFQIWIRTYNMALKEMQPC